MSARLEGRGSSDTRGGRCAMPRVLVTSGSLAGDRSLLEPLEGRYSLEYSVQRVPVDLESYCAMVVGNEDVTEEVLSRAPNLRLICRFGVHLYRIDMDAVRRRGIRVVNCPQAGSASVVEYIFGGLLYLLRSLSLVNGARQSELRTVVSDCLAGKTLGVIGLGSIGADLAGKAAALGCRILAYNRTPRLAIPNLKLTSIDEVLASSDIVTVNVSASSDTYKLIDRRRLAMMKSSAYLVNVAWPDVVDAVALREALLKGALAGAVLDFVYPKVTFHDLPHVFQTPHIAAKTRLASQTKAQMICRSFDEFERGVPLSFSADTSSVGGRAHFVSWAEEKERLL